MRERGCTVRRLHVALIVIAITLPVRVTAQPNTRAGIGQLFETRYWAWRQWLAGHPDPQGFSSEGTRWAFNNVPYRQLVALGPRSVPCILARSGSDILLLDALGEISKFQFHLRNQALRPGVVRWTVDELPGVQWSQPPDFRDIWRRWWNEVRFQTPERFAKLHDERQSLLKQGDAKGAQEKYQRIQDLGIPVLPCLVDRIGEGATDLVPIMSALTNGGVKGGARTQNRVKWWNQHKDEWTLPPASPAPVNPPPGGGGTDKWLDRLGHPRSPPASMCAGTASECGRRSRLAQGGAVSAHPARPHWVHAAQRNRVCR